MKVKVNKREQGKKNAASSNVAVATPAKRRTEVRASVRPKAGAAVKVKTPSVKLAPTREKKPLAVKLAPAPIVIAPEEEEAKAMEEIQELDPKIVQLPVMPLEEEEPSKEELEQMSAAVAVAPTPTVVEEVRGAYDGDTAYQLYLKEIGQTPLLTIEQENSLAARIKKGDKAAREQMIKANLRLVVKIARDYEGYGVPLLDLISEGNIGLMKGVERFDPSKGAKLSTYSAWWIKQAIKRALANQGKTIRLPVHVVDKLFHIRRAEARLQEAFGREPTDDEIAEELDSTPEKIRELRAASQRPASLEAPLGFDSDNRVADVVADDNADDPYQMVEEKANNAMLREVMKDLDPREVTILRYRFGLDGDNEKTLEEVGRKFGLTRERIRQIQEIALKKLRKKIDKLEASRKAA
ncbi:MAG: sigma-70 family RNA polymerase sigma factor [Verrucomicrobiales bacterium]